MDRAFSVLMFCFAGMLLLYAGLLAATGDCGLIPRLRAAKIRDKKAYARRFAGAVAITAAAPALSGVVGLLWSEGMAVSTLITGMIACVWAGAKYVRDE